jgi:histidinol phosphatase-like enzyme (inositol monophosphatase family)
MPETCSQDLIDFAGSLADAAGGVIRRYFRTAVAVDTKPDASPVTIADREAETAMRDLIKATFPDHGIHGEEFGIERDDAEYVWVLDPIDGTRAFITGKPMFGTLVALLKDGTPILGIIDQPVLGERWLGVTGQDTTFNKATTRTRPCSEIGQAILNATAPSMFVGDDAVGFERLSTQAGQTNFGGDCYAYGLLASGFIDLVVEADLKPYDFCALAPVVQGAGGVMSDWDGRPLTLGSDGRVIATGDAALLPIVRELLNGP